MYIFIVANTLKISKSTIIIW